MTEQLMDDLSNEEHEALLLMSEHGIAAPLSPAAQVMIAVTHVYQEHGGEPPARAVAAAALRAAADQVVPEEPLYGGDQRWEYERDERQESRKKLLAIAAELEAL